LLRLYKFDWHTSPIIQNFQQLGCLSFFNSIKIKKDILITYEFFLPNSQCHRTFVNQKNLEHK
jgi:hypothetical protein